MGDRTTCTLCIGGIFNPADIEEFQNLVEKESGSFDEDEMQEVL